MSVDTTASNFCSRTAAAAATKQLIGRFRKTDADDAAGFLSGIAGVFMGYPEFVAWLASDPLRGLPAQSRFVPTISEVKAFCDATVAPIYERQRQDNLAREQLRQRALPPPSDHLARERAIENVVGRFGRGWGLDAERVTEAAISPEEACIAALGITKEQFDALEDAKASKDNKPRVAPAGSFMPVGMAARDTGIPSMSLSPDLAAKVAEKQREA